MRTSTTSPMDRLSPQQTAWLAATFDRNRARFGALRMEAEGEGDGGEGGEGDGQGPTGDGEKPFAEMTLEEQNTFLLAKTRRLEDQTKGKSPDRDARAAARRVKELEKQVAEANELKASLEAASQTDAERAAKKAAEEARAAGEQAAAAKALETYGPRLVNAAFSVELAGRMNVEDISGLVADLNIARFLDEDGEVDSAAVKTYVARMPAPTAAAPAKLKSGDLGGGARSSAAATSGADLYAQRHAKTTT